MKTLILLLTVIQLYSQGLVAEVNYLLNNGKESSNSVGIAGDNLGNHAATKNLDLNKFNINEVRNLMFYSSNLNHNSDYTAFYRADNTADKTYLKLQLGDEESGRFDIGYKLYSNQQWYSTFSIDNGHVTIGTPSHAKNRRSNLDFSLKFTSKGANGTYPNLSHPAGRIYGSSAGGGWGNQLLILQAAQNWTYPGNDESRMLVLKGNGRIGIGTRNPSHKLTIKNNVDEMIRFVRSGSHEGETKYSFVVGHDGAMVLRKNGQLKIKINQGKFGFNGVVLAKEVNVTQAAIWPDYVFEKDYELKPLEELEKEIFKHKRLPGIPSADDVKKNGVSLGTMQAKLLEKIEELTLYTIEQNKRIQALEKKLGE